jgi:hypothetical protein
VTTQPTAFEQAILRRIAEREPELLAVIPKLQVQRREFSGAGSFTQFLPHAPVALQDGYVDLDALIHMPGVEHGMGASIAITSGQVELEIYTNGLSCWAGDFDGFVIDDAA